MNIFSKPCTYADGFKLLGCIVVTAKNKYKVHSRLSEQFSEDHRPLSEQFLESRLSESRNKLPGRGLLDGYPLSSDFMEASRNFIFDSFHEKAVKNSF
jgi:hypothetical protein